MKIALTARDVFLNWTFDIRNIKTIHYGYTELDFSSIAATWPYIPLMSKKLFLFLYIVASKQGVFFDGHKRYRQIEIGIQSVFTSFSKAHKTGANACIKPMSKNYKVSNLFHRKQAHGKCNLF